MDIIEKRNRVETTFQREVENINILFNSTLCSLQNVSELEDSNFVIFYVMAICKYLLCFGSLQ
jgi:hypothetical protein